MPIYTYKAIDRKGKTVKGEIEAENELDVSTQLAQLGYIPISIGFKADKGLPLWQRVFKKRERKPSRKELIIFTRQFATIVKAAVPIVEGLGVLAEQTEDPVLRKTLYKVLHDVEEGQRLSEAMSKHPNVFSELYVNTVLAGESGGVLDKVLMRLAQVFEEDEETVSNIKAALRYPIMVIVALIGAVIFLTSWVMPKFSAIYGKLGSSLPLPTQVMMTIGNWIRGPWRESHNFFLNLLWVFIIISAIITFFFLIRLFLNTSIGRIFWDRVRFNMIILGPVYTKIVMLRFISMLNTLYQAGLPILKTLDIIKLTIGNVILSQEIESIKKDVADGKGISGGVLASKFFPRLVGYMISVGEKSGSLPLLLDSLYEYYIMEVRYAIRALTALIEPIVTVILGMVVLVMALAILLPMWQLKDAIRQAV